MIETIGIGILVTLLCTVTISILSKLYNKLKTPKIDFHCIKVFHIKKGDASYGIGIVMTLFNADNYSHTISSLNLKNPSIDLAARGGASIKRIVNHAATFIIKEQKRLEPNKYSHIKVETPLTIDLKIRYGDPFEIVIYGDWILNLSNKDLMINPKHCGSSRRIISPDDWNNITNHENLSIFEDVTLMQMPKKRDKSPAETYLLFNNDKTAKFSQYGFGATNYATSKDGVMVFIIGRGIPNIKDGWFLLGKTYPEAWSDPAKLKLYNSIVAPNEKGPMPFGSFSGLEKQMGVTQGSPASSCRDILYFSLAEPFVASGLDINKHLT